MFQKMNTVYIAPYNLNLTTTQAIATQNSQSTQQVFNEFRFFYQPPDDNNFYHVTCKVLHNYVQNPETWEDDYDCEFLYQSSNAKYRVTCKLLSHSLVINILNKEFYERDFDINDLKRKYILTWHQKYNLELSLKQALPFLQDQILKSETHVAFNSETATISQRNMNIDASNQVITQATAFQPTQSYQSTQQELRLFYQPPNDNNFYHVTCKMNYVQSSENIVSWEYDYDYEFSDTIYVTCKLLSHSLIVNLLNKEIYGRDFDVNDLKRKYVLTWNQQLNLKLNLERVLPFYIPVNLVGQMGSDSNENTSQFHDNIESDTIQTISTIDKQSYFDNAMFDNNVIQDTNGQATYPDFNNISY
ncbi:hypothetical protein C1645_754281 [Glomus cerebriforme]|uniref:Uncharacterized protein n=1 Tax=Glomus cerebriforme TaxID=658196 RepID=A0A397TNU1_9GLOM|nr:hypothetical protein C1645_754281 [Glomus cerebriforme]